MRIGLAILAWEPGWSALSADDFSRVQIAREWAETPQLAHNLVWLPLPSWLNGLGFAVFGSAVATNPMLLTAILNTLAVLAAAAMVGWAGWRLFDSGPGGLIAFAAVLFTPLAFHVSLSGLSEPIYYVTVAATIAATIQWFRTGRRGWLGAAVVALVGAGLCRYEGWTLAAAWMAVVGYHLLRGQDGTLIRRIREQRWTLILLAIPMLVPVWWIALNLQRTGDPLFFLRAGRAHYASAYGGAAGIVFRLSDLPLGLWQAAHLVLIGVGASIAVHRKNPIVRAVVAIVGIAWVMLYLSSVVSPIHSARERFLFAYAVALAPLLAGLPEAARRLSDRVRRLAVVAAIALAVVVATIGILDRPRLWAPPPDFLTLADRIGAISSRNDPPLIVMGEGMTYEPVELSAWHGFGVRVRTDEVPEGFDLWIERLPERIDRYTGDPGAVIGTYAVFGPAAPAVAGEPCAGCEGWSLRDETGTTSPVPAGPFNAVRFTGDDPLPGAEAVMYRDLGPGPADRQASIELQWLYGTNGLNSGRIRVEVRVDGETIWSTDIGEPRRWVRIPFTVPATGARIAVAVVAQPRIEQGWDWGRASAVLIRRLDTGG
ncbi:MAG TPA: hypothetical protein VK960_01215 [Acidimicrobiia bacterium]|nr:hypothetical protein [Acidimicrobiia bacterium]